MRVFVVAPNRAEIFEQIYPALSPEGEVVGFATSPSPEGFAGQIESARPDLVIVNLAAVQKGQERAVLEGLSGWRLALVLPGGRRGLRRELESLAHVDAVEIEPADYRRLLRAAGREPEQPVEDGHPSREPSPDEGRQDDALPPDGDQPAPPVRPSPESHRRASPESHRRASPESHRRGEPSPGEGTGPSTASRIVSEPSPGEGKSSGRVIAFTGGLVGGPGKSTLAGTLAWLLAHEGRVDTLLLALDNPAAAVTHFKLARWPHLGLYLGGGTCPVPSATLGDAGAKLAEGEPFEKAVQRSGDLAVAVAPGDLAQYDEIGGRMPGEPGSVRSLVAEAASRHEVVVVDLPPSATGWGLHPLLAADEVVVVARPTVSGQAGVVQVMTMLPDRALHLVLNDRMSRDLSAGAFVAGVEQVMTSCPPVAAVVPHDGTVRLAQNEGVPLPQAEGVDDVSKAVRKLAKKLGYELRAEEGEEAEAEQVEAAQVGNGRFKSFRLPVRIKLTD